MLSKTRFHLVQTIIYNDIIYRFSAENLLFSIFLHVFHRVSQMDFLLVTFIDFVYYYIIQFLYCLHNIIYY